MALEEIEPAVDVVDHFTLDDFRLRLDSPLFHRDPGVAMVEAVSQLRGLTWENVGDDLAPQSSPAAAAPTMTQQPDDAPDVDDFRAKLVQAAALPPNPLLRDLPTERPTLAPLEQVLHPVVSEPVPEPVIEPVIEPVDQPVLGVLPKIDEVELQLMRSAPEPTMHRDPDPVLTGLAEMILHGISGEVEQVAPTPTPAPTLAPLPTPAATPVLNPSPVVQAPAPVVPPPPPAAPAPSLAAPTYHPSLTPPSTPAIEAELNRLAFVPEIEEPLGPVELPAILTGDMPRMMTGEVPRMMTGEVPRLPTGELLATGAPFIPSLSQQDIYAARQSAAPVAPRRNYTELAATLAPPQRRNGRHPVRRFFGFVVLLGLLAGGLFAAKYYFLDQRWSGEVKPLAAAVETARGLSFDTAVEVSTLPADQYSTKLINHTFGLDAQHVTAVAGEWRALGLLSGPLDVAAVGLAGIADAPAFYDPGAETIYVVEGLPTELRKFAIERSLALALLDQEYGWSARIAEKSPSVRLGTRALYEADALAIATSLLDDAERVKVLTQQQALYTAYQIPVSAVPFATAASTRTGLALRPYFDGAPTATRDGIERDALITDGQALDVRRLVSGVTETAGPQSEGMLFWYHVLATRIDGNDAWRAALAWRGDAVSVVRGTSGVCVTALVQVDPASFDLAAGAFQAWAGAAPVESNTSVAATPGDVTGQITVTACDPGEAVVTNDGRVRLSLGGAPLRAEQYRQLQLAFPQLPPQQLACAVYGADPVSSADERSLIDPVGGWTAVAAHPATDPNAAGCAPAA